MSPQVLIRGRQEGQRKGCEDRSRGRSRREMRGAALLALKMEEGTMNQGLRWLIEAGKSKEMDSHPGLSGRSTVPPTP